MISALAVACLALLSGAAPVPTGYTLIPQLKLEVDTGVQAEALVASPWANPDEPDSADPGIETRFIQSEVQGEPVPPAAVVEALQIPAKLRKSPPLALALTLVGSLPTAFIGPSIGHLYAGDWKHFRISGGGRLADLTLLVILEKFAPGFGIGPLVALLNPEHLGKNFSGYPLGYPVDLVLVLALIGSTVYDAYDAWRAAERFNDKLGLAAPQPMSPAAAAAIPPPAR
jgi:hypothetical protein